MVYQAHPRGCSSGSIPDLPIPFEQEFPTEAAFMQRVFAAGGQFKQPRETIKAPDLPPIKGIPRNTRCPCGSGAKTKHCHTNWL